MVHERECLLRYVAVLFALVDSIVWFYGGSFFAALHLCSWFNDDDVSICAVAAMSTTFVCLLGLNVLNACVFAMVSDADQNTAFWPSICYDFGFESWGFRFSWADSPGYATFNFCAPIVYHWRGFRVSLTSKLPYFYPGAGTGGSFLFIYFSGKKYCLCAQHCYKPGLRALFSRF